MVKKLALSVKQTSLFTVRFLQTFTLNSPRAMLFSPSTARLLAAVLLPLLFLNCRQEPKPATSTLEGLEKTTTVHHETTTTPAEKQTTPPPADAVRFVAYNVKNWLTMKRRNRDGQTTERDKPDEEKAAVIATLASADPHLVGLCEIGTKENLAEIQGMLKAAGHDLPHSHWMTGYDNTRRLGFLSKFPIASTNSQSEMGWDMDGRFWLIRRGILHVTLDLPCGRVHFMGAHFKSKREVTYADQAIMRLNEARLMREHALKTLADNPGDKVVLYGDLNETKGNPPIKTLIGRRRSKDQLEDLLLTDRNGEVWTYFWNWQHQYSRFDYILVSKNLRKFVSDDHSRILDPPNYYDASDHRALLLTLLPEAKTE